MAAMGGAGGKGILSLSIKEAAAIYAAYMPFVKNGGLFIPTMKKFKLGDDVFMLLSLMDDSERLPVAGTVVWLTPVGAENNRQAGIGVRFSPQDKGGTSKKIEGYLAGMLQSDKPTHTM